MTEKEEVFRGHLSECVEHYRDTLAEIKGPGSKGSSQLRKPLADFCGVGIHSVARWFRDPEKTPPGEVYFKLISFLDFVGYSVIDKGRMTDTHKKFVELIGFSILSGAEAAKLLGYSGSSTLYHVLRASRRSSESKDQKMWEIWKEKRKELEARKVELLPEVQVEKIPIISTVVSIEKGIGDQPSGESGSIGVSSNLEPSVRALVIQALLRLLPNESVLDQFSGRELVAFRQSVDGRLILGLSARLSTLCAKLVVADEDNGDA